MAELGHDKRRIKIQIDTIAIEGVVSPGLRVVVKATKTLKKEPNKCDVTVYNLNPAHRAALTKSARPVVVVTAGYEGQLTQIFYGQAIHVRHERRGADILTTVTNNDSGDKSQKGRIHQSFGPNTKAGDVLRALTKAMGVKVGNLNDAVRKLNAGKAASIYGDGFTFDGHAPYYLEELCRSAGLEWSIQDGALQVLDIGKALAAKAIVVDESNLIDTPTVSSKNVVEFTTFLQGDLLPGRQVQVKHPFAKVTARIEKAQYTLDSYADDWYASVEAQGAKK
jgi:hypothetical protein